MARVTGTRTLLPLLQQSTAIDEHDGWWRNKTVTERNAFMLEHSIETDVTFVFKERLVGSSSSGVNSSASVTAGAEEKEDPDGNRDEEFVECPSASDLTETANQSSAGISDETNDAIQVDNDQTESLRTTAAIDTTRSKYTEVTVEAHRYMLLAASGAFWKLLSEHADGEDIPVDGVEYNTFQLVLRFIYTDTTDVSEHTVIPLLNASKTFDLPALSAMCSEWLEKHIKTENVCTLLQQSLILKQENLALQCLKVIQNHTTEAFEAKDFVDVSRDTLSHILSSDILSIQEVTVFHYCSVWATRQLMGAGETFNGQNLRHQLGPVLYKIRFPTISLQDFTSIVVPTNVLSKEEELSIFRCLSMGANSSKCDADLTLPFPKEPRTIPKKSIQTTSEETPSASGDSEKPCSSSSSAELTATCSTSQDTKTVHKVVWSSKSKLPQSNGLLLLSPPYSNRVQVKQCVPPAEFSFQLNAVSGPLLVNGLRLGAPITNRSFTDNNPDPPQISIINSTSQENILHKYPVHANEMKIEDGFAYADLYVQPFWLLAREPVQIQVTYNINTRPEESPKQGKSSFFKNVLSYATKAMKTSHLSYGLQVLPDRFVLAKGEVKVEVEGSPNAPLFGLLYETT